MSLSPSLALPFPPWVYQDTAINGTLQCFWWNSCPGGNGAFQLGMFLLGLFGGGENIFGGTLGQVGTGLFNLGCLFWDCFVLMKMLLMEIVVRWERCFSIWDVYVGIVWC